MAASLTLAAVDAAPGNTLVLAGSGLSAGAGASVVLKAQGLVTPTDLVIPATFAGTSVTFTVPDGVMSNTLVVTAGDGTSASCFLNCITQYLQAAQYQKDGEGTDSAVAGLAAGVLDEILRDASAIIDEHIGTTLRLLQVEEDQPFRKSRRVWPLRGPRHKIPLVSLDSLKFITSNAITTTFNVSGTAPDVYTSKTTGYFEVQSYAVGNAILLGAIQTIGFSANRWDVIYTAGFANAQYPRAIRKATAIIATELLIYQGILKSGLGGLDRVRQGSQQYDRRSQPFAIPLPAAQLIAPYAPGAFG
jgi:hypothetical protein